MNSTDLALVLVLLALLVAAVVLGASEAGMSLFSFRKTQSSDERGHCADF